MKNKKKLAEMKARKDALAVQIKDLRESEKYRTGVGLLIESELEKAELVLAAKGIVDKIGKMAEDLAKVEGDDIMPMMDSLKDAYGAQMAETFQKAAGQQIRAAIDMLSKTKDAVSSEVSKLEGVVNGAAPNDMGSTGDTAAPAPAPANDDLGGDLGGEDMGGDLGDTDSMGGDDMGGDDLGGEAGDMGGDMGGEDDLFGDEDAGNAAGRARKESHARFGKALNESVLDSIKGWIKHHALKVPATGSARQRLEAMKPHLSASDYETLCQFPDHLLNKAFDEIDQGEAMAHQPMADLAESANPDAVIFRAFRKAMKEHKSPVKAARKVAEHYKIDFADVVEIVKESRLGK